MTKVYKVELMIIDHDGIGADQVRVVLENQRYPNHCISPEVANVEEREVEWSDEHPLNSRRTWRAAFEALFERLIQEVRAEDKSP